MAKLEQLQIGSLSGNRNEQFVAIAGNRMEVDRFEVSESIEELLKIRAAQKMQNRAIAVHWNVRMKAGEFDLTEKAGQLRVLSDGGVQVAVEL